MFNYFGSKHRIAHHYPVPTFRTLIEPFGGSAAYAVRHRNSFDRVVIIERDEAVVAVWHRLLGMSAAEILAAPCPTIGDLCKDPLVAFASARTTRDTPAEFRVSFRMVQQFEIMMRRIASVVDECRYFEVICGTYSDAPVVEATWFVDPPYQYQGGRRDRTRGGRYRYGNDAIDYENLGSWSQSLEGQVVVCEQAGAGWLPWNGAVRTSNSRHGGYSEVWWHNQEGPCLFAA